MKVPQISWKGVKSQINKRDWIVFLILVAHWLIFGWQQFIHPSEVSAILLGISFGPALLVPVVGISFYIEKSRKWWILAMPFVSAAVLGLIFAKIVDPFMDFWLLYAFFVFLVPSVVMTYYVIRAIDIKWT